MVDCVGKVRSLHEVRGERELDNLLHMKNTLSENIVHDLRKYILTLDISKSPQLPTEINLAEMFKVSRSTIRSALNTLEQENAVFRIHGKGTFVNPEALQIKVNLMPSQEFHALIDKSGYYPTVELIDVVRDQKYPNIALELALPEDTLLTKVEKLYLADGHATIICINYYISSMFVEPLSLEELRTKSAFHLLLEKTNTLLVRDRIEIQTKSIGQMEHITSQVKRMDCDSLLEFGTVNFDQKNRPCLYGHVFMNTNYLRFSQIRTLSVF